MITVTQPSPYVSGGGADGTIDRVVALCLERTVIGTGVPDLVVPEPGARTFDLAELLSWACRAAGVGSPLPDQAQRVLAHCQGQRTMLRTVEAGIALKGALLFGGSGARVGLSLGVRRKIIIHDPRSGGAIVDRSISDWTAAARIPGARGYR